MYNRHVTNIIKHKYNIKEGKGLCGMCMGWVQAFMVVTCCDWSYTLKSYSCLHVTVCFALHLLERL